MFISRKFRKLIRFKLALLIVGQFCPNLNAGAMLFIVSLPKDGETDVIGNAKGGGVGAGEKAGFCP